MAANEKLQQAESCYIEAREHYQYGRTEKAVELMRQSVLLYASASAGAIPLEMDQAEFHLTRAGACRELASLLTETGRHAEAANVYQEATDLYARIDSEEAEQLSRTCARKLLDNLRALNAQPQERLHLLVAHYERLLQQLCLEPNTEIRQAEVCVHIARIFQRRDRPEEAVARFEQALSLYGRVPPTTQTELERAECHHRIATILALKMNDICGAERHYHQAIELYSEHEPVEYGFQSSLELCRSALARIAPTLKRTVDPLNME